ncbi:dephospho-CoA kinase [Ferrigenium kumadai]|uniref:Dephospho-CoA kinase n=1 Tax=Ferrigenium kumadai TaxID=1682490 RepID=A0AAN1W181_9PROT|nr:dephospho-CoA kinase [Ferrigenium kumadai]BBJ00458.1 dephospho-CoA kinase [Ferrigenium kumadai]
MTLRQAQDRLIVGLTGGIGCGKSTVAHLFAEHGAGIIDTDAISHQLTQASGAAIPSIRAAFGNHYIGDNGALDRAKMRALVFSDAEARQRLEQLLHPRILEQTKVQLQQMRASPYVIVVVPLLLQSSEYRKLVERVLVVDCDEHIQIERVMMRSQMTEEEVLAIIASQTPRAERLQLADDVIRNEDGLDELAAQVAALHLKYGQNNN